MPAMPRINVSAPMIMVIKSRCFIQNTHFMLLYSLLYDNFMFPQDEVYKKIKFLSNILYL